MSSPVESALPKPAPLSNWPCSELNPVLKPTPYHFRLLHSGRSLSEIPPVLKGAISEESWRDFCSKIQPFLRRREQKDHPFRICLVIFFLLLFGGMCFSEVTGRIFFVLLVGKAWYCSYVVSLISIVLTLAWGRFVQIATRSALANACQNVEDTFRRGGLAIECAFLDYFDSSSMVVLYFHPIQDQDTVVSRGYLPRGYVRIPYFDCGCFINPVSMSHLEYYQTFPACVQSLQGRTDDEKWWSAFWSDFLHRRQAYLRLHWRQGAAVSCVVLALACGIYLALLDPFFIIAIVFAGAGVVVNSRLTLLDDATHRFLLEKSIEWASRGGCYMEPRRLTEARWYGVYRVDYLYLFPKVDQASKTQ